VTFDALTGAGMLCTRGVICGENCCDACEAGEEGTGEPEACGDGFASAVLRHIEFLPKQDG
jgi:hypothetical protein